VSKKSSSGRIETLPGGPRADVIAVWCRPHQPSLFSPAAREGRLVHRLPSRSQANGVEPDAAPSTVCPPRSWTKQRRAPVGSGAFATSNQCWPSAEVKTRLSNQAKRPFVVEET